MSMKFLRKTIVNEEIQPFTHTEKNFVGIEDDGVRTNVNALLSSATARSFVTPYAAMERVRKVLASYQVFIQSNHFMQGDHGNLAINISQFGLKFGQTNDGEFKVHNDSPYYLYFEWMMNDSGMFDIYTELVDEDDLAEILDDYDADYNSENDEDDEDDQDNEHHAVSNQEQDHDTNIKDHAGKRIYESNLGKKKVLR